ncbi:MAG TPA: YeeE/YedE thiosulfate transporter family protein [Beijerinckiaceae bacterium]|nr:YeeE/YedE thiosulfate transporter family protein [Beijerinckiaceae bacterium]
MSALASRSWSPYVAGIVIGLLQIPAFLLMGTALGTSSSYVTISASIAQVFDPSIAEIKYAANHLTGAKNWWQVALIGGIVVGAFLSSRLSGTGRWGASPVWARAMGAHTPAQRYLMAFTGGFIMVLGARIADGCTSGHGVSGIAQLAIGSFVAVTAMFGAGIVAANLIYRRV